MLTLIKKTLLTASLLVAVALPVVGFAPQAFAIDPAAKQAACQGIGGATGSGGCDESQANSSIESMVAAVITILSWIIGVASVIMVMIGGFKYITSQGDSNGTSSAKNTILYAIIGLVVALLAQALVQFVLNRTA